MRLSTVWMVLLLPATFYLAAWSFATGQNDPTSGAEAQYLAMLMAGALTLQAAIGAGRGRGLLWTAGLGLVALLTVAAGSTRGALCMTVVALGLVTAFRTGWRANRAGLSIRWMVAACMAVQLFARPRLLLDPGADPIRLAVILLVLPAVIGVCLVLLAERSSAPAALIVGGTVAVLSPGWNVSISTLFLALAGAAWMATVTGDEPRDEPRDERAGGRHQRWLARLGAGALILLPTIWHGWAGTWPVGLAASITAIAIVIGWRSLVARLVVVTGLGLAVLAMAAWWPGASGGREQVLAVTLLVLTLVPTLPLLLVHRVADARRAHRADSRRAQGTESTDGGGEGHAWSGLILAADLLLAGSLVILASRFDAAPAALGALLAWMVLSSPGRAAPAREIRARDTQTGRQRRDAVQGWWTAIVVMLTSLLAAYPWARQEAFHDAVALLGVERRGNVAVLVVVLTAAAWGWGRWGRQILGNETNAWPRRWLQRAVLAAIAITLFLLGTAPPGVVFVPATTLHARSGTWQVPLPTPMTARGVVVDSIAANSLELAPGSVIGMVQLLDPDQEIIAEWPMISGEHTAEWAMERPDVAALLAGAAPAPYAAGMVVNGTFFARWFRAHFALDMPVDDAAHVAIRMASNVPDGLQVVLRRVEVAP